MCHKRKFVEIKRKNIFIVMCLLHEKKTDEAWFMFYDIPAPQTLFMIFFRVILSRRRHWRVIFYLASWGKWLTWTTRLDRN